MRNRQGLRPVTSHMTDATDDQAEPELESFYTTLWIGALLLAANPAFDAFPDELGEVAVRFFSLCPPVAKA